MKFNEWLFDTYETEWSRIKNTMKEQGFSMEVILDEKQSLYENYLETLKEESS